MVESARCVGDATVPAVEAGDARRVERRNWSRRRRLERQLHDGAALRISALAIQLGLFRHRIPPDAQDLCEFVDGFQEELHAVLQELRDVAGQLYPPLLDQAGLGAALREEAGRLAAPVRITASDDRFGPAAEGAAYFAVLGYLAGLPPDGQPVEVSVRREGATLVVVLAGADVGCGGPLLEAARPLGGTVDVEGGPGSSTIIARFPCE